MKESVVEIPEGSGNQYRYGYDPANRATKYLGPVGQAPAMAEQEFNQFAERFFSLYEWERGEVVIPSKEWTGLRKKIIDAWNKQQEVQRDTMIKIYDYMMDKGPTKLEGKRKRVWILDNDDLEKLNLGYVDRSYGGSYFKFHKQYEDLDWHHFTKIMDVPISFYAGFQSDSKPKKVTKKSMDEHLPMATTRTTDFNMDDAVIRLITREVIGKQTGTKKEIQERYKSYMAQKRGDVTREEVEVPVYQMKKQRVFVWDVDENNHAVEGAHDHPVAKAAFEALADIEKWPKGTGGTIRYQDEYAKDEGFGATERFVYPPISPSPPPRTRYPVIGVWSR